MRALLPCGGRMLARSMFSQARLPPQPLGPYRVAAQLVRPRGMVWPLLGQTLLKEIEQSSDHRLPLSALPSVGALVEGQRGAHGRVGLDVLHPVVVHDPEPAGAEGVG